MYTLVLLIFCFTKALGNAFDEIQECSTDLAEVCFRGYFDEFVKLTEEKINITDICATTAERITCSRNVIDSDCKIKDGRENFDNWMDGITSVFHYICNDSKTSLNALFKTKNGTKCFDTTGYVECIARKTKVTHIVDLLKLTLDNNECNWILLSSSTCAVKSTVPGENCYEQQISQVLNEILHIFVQQTKCTSVCFSTASYTTAINCISIATSLLLTMYDSIRSK